MQPTTALASLAIPALATLASAQTFTILVRDGDVIAGVGSVTAIDDLEVNDAGTWLVKVDTDFATSPGDGVVLLNGAQHSRETDPLLLPAGAAISSYDDIVLDDSGRAVWNLFLTGLTPTTDSGVFRNHQLILQEGANSGAPQFGGVTPYLGFFGVKHDGANVLVALSSVDDPTIATTVDRALMRLQLDGAGTLTTESVIVKEGDALAGIPVETLADLSTGPHSWAVNRGGQSLYLADMTGTTTNDGLLMLDLLLLAREGSPAPVVGRNWEILLGKSVHLDDAGNYAFTGNLDGVTTDDEVICKNGTTIVVQEGTSLPGTGGFAFTGFGSGPIAIDAAGTCSGRAIGTTRTRPATSGSSGTRRCSCRRASR